MTYTILCRVLADWSCMAGVSVEDRLYLLRSFILDTSNYKIGQRIPECMALLLNDLPTIRRAGTYNGIIRSEYPWWRNRVPQGQPLTLQNMQQAMDVHAEHERIHRMVAERGLLNNDPARTR